MVPYTTEDLTMQGCRELADRLRAEGEYAAVTIRRRAPEMRAGVLVPFGKVYVLPKTPLGGNQ